MTQLWEVVQFNAGSAHGVAGSAGVVVGDRYVPEVIEAEMPGVDGQPTANLRIEVRGGVPRCVDLRIAATDGGRELRPKDLAAVDLDHWVEFIVSACSWVIVSRDGSEYMLGSTDDDVAVRAGARAIQRARKNSRRPMTHERLQRVAEAYNSRETLGLEAVESAFACSRATACRYVAAARSASLIDDRRRNRS